MLQNLKSYLNPCLSVNYHSLAGLLLLLFITTSVHTAVSQTGVPTIFNHKKSDYKAAISNWDIIASDEGYVYAANSTGLLIFDGFQWVCLPLPNKSIVRSVFLHDSKIYVGGQDEVGYFQKSQVGTYEFTSLRRLVPNIHLPLEDIWNICVLDDVIYFNSKDRVYMIEGEGCTVIHTGNPIFGMTSTSEAVYFVDQADGVYCIGRDSLLLVLPSADFPESIVDLSGSNTDLFFITNGGRILRKQPDTLYEVKTALTPYFAKNQIQAIQANANSIFIGTRYGGIAMMAQNGETFNVLKKQDGLQNNHVNALSIDMSGNLWSATANGIDHILAADHKHTLYPDGELHGSVYDIVKHKQDLYFGTSNGLYKFDNDSDQPVESYTLVAGTEGQVWGLDIVEGDLLMAHNNGAFLIKDGKAEKISPGIGAWKFVAAPDRKHMYVGTYYGVELYKKTAHAWKFVKKYDYPQESSRLLVPGMGNNLWVSHPYRGVYRMIIDKDFNLVTSEPYYGQKGLPSNQMNYIFEVNGQMVVAAETGVYEYDVIKDRFVASQWLSEHLPKDVNIRSIQSDMNGNIWYITNEEVGKLDRTTASLRVEYYPELVNKFIGGFETMYVLDSNYIYAASDEGAIKYKISTDKSNTESSLQARICSLTTNSGTSLPDTAAHKLPADENTLIAIFSNDFLRADVKYQYYLQGADDDWSEWSNDQTKEFANLSSGTYSLEVRAMTPDGFVSPIVRRSFEIAAPWYRTKLAYLAYGFMGLLMILGLLLIPNKRYQRQKAMLLTAQEEKEAELQKIKNEKLTAELEHQNSELASSTLHLVQKNSTLQKVKSDIESLRKSAKDPELRKQLKGILSSLSDDERLEEEWENFSIHFDKVHANFLKRLKHQYPNLSPKDQKLAAYLRMNLSTKEIAPMLNISVRGVEISRYRLRKKLDLEKETNLSEWMMNY